MATRNRTNGQFTSTEVLTTADIGTLDAKALDNAGASALTKSYTPPEPNVYTGNVMHINYDIKDPRDVYALVMVRFCNQFEIKEMAVKLFPKKDGCYADQGDLVCFEAKDLTFTGQFMDEENQATPLYRAKRFNDEHGIKVVKTAAPAAEVEVIDEIQSPRFLSTITKVSDRLKGWLSA